MVEFITDYITDEDIENSLRLQFDYEEMFDMDFKTVFSQLEDLDEDYLRLKLRGRVFLIDKVTAAVSEVLT